MADAREPTAYPDRRPGIPLDVPVRARCYDYCLGGKDNFSVDREAVLSILARFPEGLDIVRESRLFLHRAVRYLARDAGIDQFVDMGAGLPTRDNVHQVAQRFRPDARVVYVDIDPMVLAHGRALLAKDDLTAIVTGDLAESAAIRRDPEVARLIDFDRPVAVLYVSVFHAVLDDDAVLAATEPLLQGLAPGSHVVLSQFSAEDSAMIAQSRDVSRRVGVEMCWRTPEVIRSFIDGWEPVEPGLVDVAHWHPDPEQPSLGEVDAALRQYLGASHAAKRLRAYGGVARKPG